MALGEENSKHQPLTVEPIGQNRRRREGRDCAGAGEWGGLAIPKGRQAASEVA